METLQPYHFPSWREKAIKRLFPNARLWSPSLLLSHGMRDVTPYQRYWTTYGLTAKQYASHPQEMELCEVVAWGEMRPVFLQPQQQRRDEAVGRLYR